MVLLMSTLLHIRVGKRLKEKMQDLIDQGLFSNQSEIAREAVRDLLLKYADELYDGKKK